MCSLGCAMGWDVRASSSSAGHEVKYLDDFEADTAWASGPGGMGVGQSVTFSFPKNKFIQGSRKVNVDGFVIVSGFGVDEPTWRQYARPRELRVTHNGRPVCRVVLRDVMESQEFWFARPEYIKPGDSLRVEIREIYRGSESLPVAITYLVPLGAH